MTPKIALEEHFMIPELVEHFRSTRVNIDAALFERGLDALSDLGERRLSAMAAAGITKAVLSIAGPGVQLEPDAARAVRLARLANDRLADAIRRRPAAYGGFAHLPMQDPAAAVAELDRCMGDLGFCGAMVNGQTGGRYLDDPVYEPFWERAAALGAPVYIHPGNPADRPAMYDGHSELWGPVWSWGVETATHALRLVFAGVFERHPGATLILGHMGEAIPFQLWRIDGRWEICNQGGRTLAEPPSAYIRRNVAVTTSGVCSDEPLRCAIDALGADRVMFSADYPFERIEVAAGFIEGAKLDDVERARICHGNAEKILRLG